MGGLTPKPANLFKRAHSEWKGVPPPAICDGGAKSVAAKEGQRVTAAATEAGSLTRPPFDDVTLPKEGGEISSPEGDGLQCQPTRRYSGIANW